MKNIIILLKFSFLIFIFFNVSNLFAQNIYFTDQSNEPISDVNVVVSHPESNLVVNLTSDINGKISLSNYFIPSYLKYDIIASHISFHKSISEHFIRDSIIILSSKNTLLDQVVITAQISPRTSSKSIHKISVIDKSYIKAKGAVNLQNLLQDQMNLRLSQDNILGSSISIQGLSGQNVKILIDDIPVIGRLNGNIDLSQINLNNIERVEIVEGPLSVSYGSDALAGTINLISKKQQQKKLSTSLSTYYESVGHYNFDMDFGLKIKNNLFKFSSGRNYFDGWSKGESFQLITSNALADTSRFLQWKPKEQYFADMQYILTNKNYNLRIFYQHFNEKITNRGMPRLPYYENAFDDYYYTLRDNFGVNFNLRLKENENLNFLLAYNIYNRIKNTYFKDLTTLEETLTESESDQDTSLFTSFLNKVIYSNTADSNLNYQIGYEVKNEYAKGQRIINSKQYQSNYAIFSNIEFYMKKLTFRPGLRFAYNSDYKAPVIPSINLMYPFKDFKIRLSYAKGFRAPALKELYFEFVDINHNILGNSSLKSEASNNFHLDIDWKKNLLSKTLFFDLSGFHNNIKNLISLAQSSNSSEYTYFNLGEYQTMGARFQAKIKTNRLEMSIGNSLLARYNSLSSGQDVKRFSYSSDYKASIFWDLNFWDLQLASFYKFTGNLQSFAKLSDGEIVETNIDKYQILDVSLSKSIKNIGEITLGAKNIFNITDVSSFSIGQVHSTSSSSTSVGYGRTFYSSIKFYF
tara:strand:- start:1272 stop:3518 length:2247 start_codon:yes stop_codon:yes gene_type:complete